MLANNVIFKQYTVEMNKKIVSSKFAMIVLSLYDNAQLCH